MRDPHDSLGENIFVFVVFVFTVMLLVLVSPLLFIYWAIREVIEWFT